MLIYNPGAKMLIGLLIGAVGAGFIYFTLIDFLMPESFELFWMPVLMVCFYSALYMAKTWRQFDNIRCNGGMNNLTLSSFVGRFAVATLLCSFCALPPALLLVAGLAHLLNQELAMRQLPVLWLMCWMAFFIPIFSNHLRSRQV